jgi:hypothetical protein
VKRILAIVSLSSSAPIRYTYFEIFQRVPRNLYGIEFFTRNVEDRKPKERGKPQGKACAMPVGSMESSGEEAQRVVRQSLFLAPFGLYPLAQGGF